MVPKVQAGFKAEVALLARVDAFGAEMMREHPGLSVSRTDAIVMLLTEALNARGIEAPTEKGPAPARRKAASRRRS